MVLGEANERTAFFSQFAPIKEIQLAQDAEAKWGDGGLTTSGVPGFNETRLKPEAREILSVEGRPLLVLGQYGQGRTVAFTGFTPAYREEHAEWDTKVIYPYLVDQELYQHPATKAYLYLLMEILADASGQKPQVTYDAFVAAREKPLFEMLKDLPLAEVKVTASAAVKISGNGAAFSMQVSNSDHYARLLRVRAEWDDASQSTQDLALYDDNYFDLVPGEIRTIQAKLPLVATSMGHFRGKLIVEGTNVRPTETQINAPDQY